MKFQNNKKKVESKNPWTLTNIVTIMLAFIWFLAVLKVYLLEYKNDRIQIVHTVVQSEDLKPNLADNNNSIKPQFVLLTDNYKSNNRQLKKQPLISASTTKAQLPSFTDWQYIRSSSSSSSYFFPKRASSSSLALSSDSLENIRDNDLHHADMDIDGKSIMSTLPTSELQWPPVLPNGIIPPEDGYDVMPYSGLKVPRFWKQKDGEDVLKIGSKVNGFETIFLMIASYRDFQCRETIASAFLKSDHPERLYIGAVDQVIPGDIGCLDLEIPCIQDDTRPLCIYKDHISIYKMDASTATGPVTARHIGDRMYRGQYFVMQMDAHCPFTRHWDTNIIIQWRETENEMAVLSSYLTDIQGSIDENGDSTRNTRPIMCNSDYEGQLPSRYLRHGGQPEEQPIIKDMPQLQPFWAAGFSFSRGHFKVQVPYDGYQPMVFQGEEIAIGIRGFTYGYDFYAPKASVVFHEYASQSKRRKKVHMFWENTAHAGEGQKSLRRATAIIGMAPDLDPSTYDHTEQDKYGLGTVRSLDLFYKIFLINRYERKAVLLCPFVRSGKMHKDFQQYLRTDGLGIDYNKLQDYDTQTVMKNLNWKP